MAAKMNVRTVLDLSIGTTLLISPSCKALKYQSHDAPVASPDSTRNTSVFASMTVIADCDPTTNTMIHENNSTMIVRMAVATLESVFLMPHFARIDVTPAKNADRNANRIHIASSFQFSKIHRLASLFYPIRYCITKNTRFQKEKRHSRISPKLCRIFQRIKIPCLPS